MRHYSLSQARRSLVLFGVGRLVSAVSGFAVLVLMVRAMPTSDYGGFVAFMAFLEIFYLLSGFGLSSIAQRYVPEFRVRASAQRLASMIWFATLARLIAAGICALVVVLSATFLLDAIGLPMPRLPGESFALFWWLLLVSGVAIRFLDEILAALLLQGASQSLALLRNLGRLAVLVTALLFSFEVNIGIMLGAEVVIAGLAVCVGMVVLWRELRKPDNQGDPHYIAPGMWSISLRFFLIQVLGQFYGPNAVKLLVSRLLGLEATAILGFAQSLADMLRNYLPAHLLAGWIRPLLVSRFVSSGDVSKLGLHAGLVLKVNLYGVVPLVLAFAVAGDAIGDLASSGKFSYAGGPLTLLSILIGLQTAHLLLNMITITLQKPNANIVATAMAVTGLAVAWGLAPVYGVQGAIVGMLTAEFLWIAIVWTLIAQIGIVIRVEWPGILKILLAGLIVGVATFTLQQLLEVQARGATLAIAATAVAIYAFILLVARPLSAAEREVIGKFVPTRWLPI